MLQTSLNGCDDECDLMYYYDDGGGGSGDQKRKSQWRTHWWVLLETGPERLSCFFFLVALRN